MSDPTDDRETEVKDIAGTTDDSKYPSTSYSDTPIIFRDSSSIQKAMDSLTENSAYAKMMEEMTATNSIHKAMESLVENSAYARMVEQMKATSSIHRALESITANCAYQKIVEQMKASSSIHKALESITVNSAYNKMVEQMKSTSSIHKTLESITANCAYAKMVDQMKATSSIHKAMESLTSSIAYGKKMIEQMQAASSVQKAMDSLATSSAYAKTIAALSTSSSLQSTFDAISSTESFRAALVSLAIPANLQASLVGFDFEAAGIPRQENKIAEQIDRLAQAEESSDFLRLFREIPTAIQVIMLFMVLQILLPIINSVTANIVTPYVETIIEKSMKPRRELVKAIASTRIEDIDLRQHRFVAVEVLHLRERPSTKSQILDDLRLGQILTVVSKERNWIEVTYTHDDGAIMQGWVFARYAEKFKP